MRVAFVHSNNEDVGGSDVVLLRLVRACRDHGYDVDVYLGRATSVVADYRKLGVDPVLVAMPRVTRSRNPAAVAAWGTGVIRSSLRLRRLFAVRPPDLVFANDFNELPALVAGRSRGVPTVATLRFIFDAPGVVRRAYVSLLARLSDRVVCVSDAVRAANFSGVSADLAGKAVTLYDWAEAEAEAEAESEGVPNPAGADDAGWPFARFGIPSGRRVVLMAGRIEPWKGQHVLMDAAPAVFAAVPDAVVLYLGSGVRGRGREAYLDGLRARAAAGPLSGRVYFGGHVPDAPALMRRAAAVVHASVSPEPFGLTVIEALAAGTPLVAAGAGGPAEVVGDSGCALLHRPGNADDLAAKLISVLTDPAGAARMADRGRRRARDFGQARRWPPFDEMFRSLAARRPAPTPQTPQRPSTDAAAATPS